MWCIPSLVNISFANFQINLILFPIPIIDLIRVGILNIYWRYLTILPTLQYPEGRRDRILNASTPPWIEFGLKISLRNIWALMYIKRQMHFPNPEVSYFCSLSIYNTSILCQTQLTIVRYPGHTIHFMRYGYENFIERLIELARIQQPEDWKPYESWNPNWLQDLETNHHRSSAKSSTGISREQWWQ